MYPMYRQIKSQIENLLAGSWKPIILILGPRQVGKSTLARDLAPQDQQLIFNFDYRLDIETFTGKNRHDLATFAENNQGKTIIIDEIQKAPEATGIVKHLYDNFKQYHLKFILTGSSEIKIRHGIGDSLVGRIYEARLYPLSLSEINIQSGLDFTTGKEYSNYDHNQTIIQKYLVYGSLPPSQNIPPAQYEGYLREYVNSLFSKDVLELSGARKPLQVLTLARHLALQTGQLVNLNELAGNVELQRSSVYKFLDVFEQLGLIHIARPISTNERESISHATKVYFTDLGIRNALTNNFDDFSLRTDKGQLLENAVFMGLKRQLDYQRQSYKLGFFRSPHGAEIDIVKKTDGVEELYEIKVSGKRRGRLKNVNLITLETAQKYLY